MPAMLVALKECLSASCFCMVAKTFQYLENRANLIFVLKAGFH